MTQSFSEVLTAMRTKGGLQSVDASLTIHSQAKPGPAELAAYMNDVYFGYGQLLYGAKTESEGRLGHGDPEHLFASPEGQATMTVIGDGAYATPPVTGSSGETQSFLVTGSAAQHDWDIRIEPLLLHERKPTGPQPQARISFTRPGRAPWTVDVTNDGGFLRGVGPDPSFPAAKAMYSVVFGEIRDVVV